MDATGGNLRLQANSPCINAGANRSAPTGPDLDYDPRILGDTVDMGAYEFQSPQSLISYAWLQQYGLPIDRFVDSADTDGDGLNNWQEWRTGTNPTTALSVLRLLNPVAAAPGVVVSWQSASGVTYFLERGVQIRTQPRFSTIAKGIIGELGTTKFMDTERTIFESFFYRVGVEE